MRSQEIRRRQMGQDSMGRGDRPGDMMGRQVTFDVSDVLKSLCAKYNL